MKIANIHGRPALVNRDATGWLDIPTVSQGEYASVLEVLNRWEQFQGWAQSQAGIGAGWQPLPDRDAWGPPVPRPGQILAAGMNYPGKDGAPTGQPETARDPGFPETFMKSPNALTGPYGTIEIPSATIDYEVELVAVIGKAASRRVAGDAAMAHVAGFMVGQDVSDRALQAVQPPALSIAKSFTTFAPTGPWFVTPDELGDLSGLSITCSVNGEQRQHSTLGSMLRSVPQIIELYSAVGALTPGDLVYFGTPAGVGMTQDPPRYLRDGDIVRSEITGIGYLENRCVKVDVSIPFYDPD